MSARRPGLPVVVKMRHDAHYVEEMVARSGAAIGRMIAIEEIEPSAEQPRKDLGELAELTESVREKGVLEPLLVRHQPLSGKYTIISGERRYHAARAAGLREVPCIEKNVDDSETLEIALIENLQRKDLTPFEAAEGLQSLAERFGLTHEEIARKIGKGRSSVTELLSLRSLPPRIKALCLEKGIISKSQLLQVARQESEERMRDLVTRFTLGMVNRDQAREERQPGRKPQPAVFRFVPPAKDFRLVLRFRKSNVERQEVIQALRRILETLESERD